MCSGQVNNPAIGVKTHRRRHGMVAVENVAAPFLGGDDF